MPAPHVPARRTRRPGPAGIWVLAVVAALAGSAAWAKGAAAPRKPIVVYYANETTQQAFESANYATLLSVLGRSTNPIAATIAANLVVDARGFPASVVSDMQSLAAAARHYQFDLAIFSNALTMGGVYLILRADAQAPEVHDLPPQPPASTTVLATSPLSRPDYFALALREVGTRYPAHGLDVVLVTNSHGDDDMALIPRVFADLAAANSAELARELDAEAGDNSRPYSVAHQGTGKIEYWRVLAQASAAYGMRFPLVFRAACESGIASWAEFFAIPDTVGVVAHTGMETIEAGQIDFGALFASGAKRLDVRRIAAELERRGIHADSRATVWTWALRGSLYALPAIVFFVPLAAWLAWYGLLLPALRARRSRAAQAASAGSG